METKIKDIRSPIGGVHYIRYITKNNVATTLCDETLNSEEWTYTFNDKVDCPTCLLATIKREEVVRKSQQENIIKITEFFDPYNMEHIKAYKYLSIHGFWQEGFLPKNIEYANNSTWQTVLAFKMADVWIEQVLAGNVVGMPPVESVEPCDTEEGRIKCSMCGKLCDAKTAHLHQGKYIGDECCWDERLRLSE